MTYLNLISGLLFEICDLFYFYVVAFVQ
jgi:hypothetical protein